MPNPKRRAMGRRTLLGGATAVAVTGALPSATAFARSDPPGGLGMGSIDATVSRLERDLIALRRAIHAHPELAGMERRTAALVARRLRAAGLEVETGVGGHGVVGIVRGARPGRTVAYRADMDAVPPGGQIPGGDEPAHLCGHDIHTTVGVGVAQVLARLRGMLRGTVVFVFQPAEENLSGAAAMLADGVLRWTDPSEIHALHCAPFPAGRFGVMPGYGLPGLDQGTITLSGPDADGQAERLAVQLGELGTVAPPEQPEGLEQLVTDLQTPNGPLAEFVYMHARAADARVEVSYRCWPEDRHADVRRDIRRLAAGYDNAIVEFPEDPFPAMVSDERQSHALGRYLRHAIGRDRVTTLHASVPFNGEDFALFLNRIPGTFTYLGVGRPGAPLPASYPHFTTFDPDERAIGYGVRAMAGWLAHRAHR